MTALTEMAPGRRLTHEYETIYILQPTTPPANADKVSGRVLEVLTRLGGTLVQVDNWGKRRLAYPIHKNSRGIFVYVRYVGHNDLVAEIERNLRLLDMVMRFQTIRVRGDVDPAAFEIDPDDVKFVAIEITEEEEEENIEQRLGLVTAPDSHRHRAPEEDLEATDDDGADAEADAVTAGDDQENE